MEQLPPPGPAGYQPGPGEGFAWFDVDVESGGRRLSARYRFPAARPYAEAQQVIVGVLDGLAGLIEPEPADPAPVVTGQAFRPSGMGGQGPALVDVPATRTATKEHV